MLRALLITFSLINPHLLLGQPLSDEQKRSIDKVSEAAGLPAVFRTPETGLGIGGVLIYTADTSVDQPSPIVTGIMYTEKKQILWAIGTKQRFAGGDYSLFGYTGITKFPQKFYGIGNQTRLEDEEVYEERRVHVEFGMERRIWNSLFLAFGLHGQQDSHARFEEDGQFARGEVHGQDGGKQHGFQTYLYWDTANDNFYPSAGSRISLSYNSFLRQWGSEYPFDGIRLDARSYQTVRPGSILAGQVYLLSLNGNPPFYQLGELGGNDLLRGYFKGRYRDRKLALVQGEFRQEISRSWRAVLFAGMGNVERNLDEFQFHDLKPSYGVGLRYQVAAKQKLNVRLDVGIGDVRDGPQVYLYVMEAF